MERQKTLGEMRAARFEPTDLRRLLLYPNKILREPCVPVSRITDEIRALAVGLRDTMLVAGGLGLAAPQIGSSVRMMAVRLNDEPVVMINPVLTVDPGAKKERKLEGCLSFPNTFIPVERFFECGVTYVDVKDGEPRTFMLSGLEAREVQHEIEHLDGKLLIDHASVLKREMMNRHARKNAGGYIAYEKTPERVAADAARAAALPEGVHAPTVIVQEAAAAAAT